MTKTDKFIEDLKANGYVEGDLSTLPADISDADRRKVEQHEADRANEQMKAYRGQKPELSQHHVQLNPNQYGYAETDIAGDAETAAKRKAATSNSPQTTKRDPLDHDNDGRKGGVAKPVDNTNSGDKK